MKRFVVFLLVLAVLSTACVCFAAGKDVKDLKLGFILGSREHAFYLQIEKGIEAAAKDIGFNAVVLESELSGALATERIESLVVDGMDAISL